MCMSHSKAVAPTCGGATVWFVVARFVTPPPDDLPKRDRMVKYGVRRWWRAATLAAAAIVLPAAVHGDEPEVGMRRSAIADTVARQQAADLYQARCADCHGDTAEGKGDPHASLQAPEAYRKLRRDTAYDFRHAEDVRHPHAGVATPTRDELAAIGAYIRETLAEPAPRGDLEQGAQIYQRTCSVCHGEDGNGASWAHSGLNPAPVDFTSPEARRMSRLHMLNTVTYGSPKTAMMGFATQLSRQEIAAVVDYIRETFVFPEGRSETASGEGGNGNDTGGHAAHGHDGGPTDMAAALPQGLSGNAERGGELYRENCVPCHGRNGQGDGPRAYFMFRKPANLGSPEALGTLNRPHLFASISKGVTGTEMPAWSTVLSDQQIADIAEYVFTSFIRPQRDRLGREDTSAPAAADHDHGGGDDGSHDAGGNDQHSHPDVGHGAAAPPADVKKN